MKRILSKQAWKANGRNVIALAALLALSFGLLATAFFARTLTDQASKRRTYVDNQRITTIASQITDRMSAYEQMLISGAALLYLQPDASQEDWKSFSQSLRTNERYPSTLGFGHVDYFPVDELATYEARMQATGHSNFSVRPAGARAVYTSITYLEPESEVNERAIGYDMFTEPTRHRAMQKAIDTAAVAMTDPVDLVQFSDQPNAAKGVLIYYPIYASNPVPTTVTARRQSVKGFTYVVLQPENVIAEITQAKPNNTSLLELYDTTTNTSAVVASRNLVRTKQSLVSQSMHISDRTWRLSIASVPLSDDRQVTSVLAIATGTAISIISATAVYVLLLKRVTGISRDYTKRIQQTKDEMLALASHQLRTPASGVKQYIGMLTQGYAGKLSRDQKAIAEKAYLANERQLEIINLMLYVAKADAGQLLLEPTKINLRELAENAINIQHSHARSKKITLKLQTKRPAFAYGDTRYINMIVENLVNNAIKYSPPSSEITLRTFYSDGRTCLAVTDHGVGIAEKDQGAIFEKFARVDNSLSKSEGGNGLGLYLAHGLAHAHGGRLVVSSKVDEGSTFTLCLPRQQPSKGVIRVQLNKIPRNTNNRKTRGV